MVGGAGIDSLTGGGGTDTFVLRPGFNSDVITDFGAAAGASHDVIEISSGLAANFAALNITASGQNVVITFDTGDTLTLQRVAVTAVTADDFVFV